MGFNIFTRVVMFLATPIMLGIATGGSIYLPAILLYGEGREWACYLYMVLLWIGFGVGVQLGIEKEEAKPEHGKVTFKKVKHTEVVKARMSLFKVLHP